MMKTSKTGQYVDLSVGVHFWGMERHPVSVKPHLQDSDFTGKQAMSMYGFCYKQVELARIQISLAGGQNLLAQDHEGCFY